MTKRVSAVHRVSARLPRLAGVCLRAVGATLALCLAVGVITFVAGYAAAAMGIGIEVATKFIGILALAAVAIAELLAAVYIWRRARRRRFTQGQPMGSSN